ncbi:contact-dependent growth inhibition system immunity protein [Streptomyces sp. NPDC001661]
MTDLALSLEQAEGGAPWPAPDDDSTRLVRTAHALRRRPIGELDAEGVRLLISHGIGLEVPTGHLGATRGTGVRSRTDRLRDRP